MRGKRKTMDMPATKAEYRATLKSTARRLDAAVEQKRFCEDRLKELNQEIPKLQAVIRSIEAFYSTPPEKQNPLAVAAPLVSGVPEHLQRYVTPRMESATAQQTEHPNDEDAFLPDVDGSEIAE